MKINQIKQRRNSIPFFLVLTIFFTGFYFSCSEKDTYSKFYSFHNAEWDMNNDLKFEVPIDDTLSLFDVYVEIRNNNNYKFQNIWLFIDYQNPQGNIRKDTLETDIADVFGKWYGKGISLYSYAIPYELNKQYPNTGTYTYTIRQGMREIVLTGISDVGLRILKKTNQ